MRDNILPVVIIILILLHGFLLIDQVREVNKSVKELESKVEQYQRMSEQDINLLLNNLKIK